MYFIFYFMLCQQACILSSSLRPNLPRADELQKKNLYIKLFSKANLASLGRWTSEEEPGWKENSCCLCSRTQGARSGFQSGLWGGQNGMGEISCSPVSSMTHIYCSVSQWEFSIQRRSSRVQRPHPLLTCVEWAWASWFNWCSDHSYCTAGFLENYIQTIFFFSDLPATSPWCLFG